MNFDISQVLETGGGNFNIDGLAIEMDSGYSVSLPGFEFKMPMEGITQDKIMDQGFAIAALIEAGNLNHYYVGCRITEGYLWMDISTNIFEYGNAMAFARAGRQKAIFCFATKEELTVIYP